MSWLANIYEHAADIAVGAGLTYLLLWWRSRSLRKLRALEAAAILERARSEAEVVIRDARIAATKEGQELRAQIEASFNSRRTEQAELEKRLSQREILINSQLERVTDQTQALQEQKEALRERSAALARQEQDAAAKLAAAEDQLQKFANLTLPEARETILKKAEGAALKDANSLARNILDDARNRAEEKARQILVTAIQRYAGELTFQTTTTSIALQGDEIKGRIIGREGRNIRAFEAATGVTVLIDDSPGAVLLSGFDPVRREVAREAMTRLIQDGRIHPTRIEEVVAEVSTEMEETIVRLGEDAVAKAGLPPMNPEVVRLLGRLHFRHSYSQNILDHSVEVAQLMGLMAAELGLEVSTAKRAGLLHDIGKAVNHEIEGPHALVGAEILKRQGELDLVVNAVASHHNDIPSNGPYGVLVSAADAISASRPGARSETMTTYLKRVEDLERIASSLPGVDKAFAVQAGRELRVFVQPDKVDDEQAFALARSVATRIENELQYPGQIRIVVIREMRCIEVAK